MPPKETKTKPPASKIKTNAEKNDKSKNALSISWLMVIIVNMAIAVTAVLATIQAFVSMQHMDYYFEVVGGYDKGALLSVLGSLGIVVVMVSSMGIIITTIAASSHRTRQKIRIILFSYVGWLVGLVVLLILSNLVLYFCTESLENSFKTGFVDKMGAYQLNENVRKSIDFIQSRLSCCGNYNFEEWFSVSWSDTMPFGEMGVPESCCDVTKAGVCVTTVPYQKSLMLTPHKIGCVSKLVELYESVLYKEISAFCVASALACVGSIVTYVLLKRPADKKLPEWSFEEKEKLLKNADAVEQTTDFGKKSNRSPKVSKSPSVAATSNDKTEEDKLIRNENDKKIRKNTNSKLRASSKNTYSPRSKAGQTKM